MCFELKNSKTGHIFLHSGSIFLNNKEIITPEFTIFITIKCPILWSQVSITVTREEAKIQICKTATKFCIVELIALQVPLEQNSLQELSVAGKCLRLIAGVAAVAV